MEFFLPRPLVGEISRRAIKAIWGIVATYSGAEGVKYYVISYTPNRQVTIYKGGKWESLPSGVEFDLQKFIPIDNKAVPLRKTFYIETLDSCVWFDGNVILELTTETLLPKAFYYGKLYYFNVVNRPEINSSSLQLHAQDGRLVFDKQFGGEISPRINVIPIGYRIFVVMRSNIATLIFWYDLATGASDTITYPFPITQNGYAYKHQNNIVMESHTEVIIFNTTTYEFQKVAKLGSKRNDLEDHLFVGQNIWLYHFDPDSEVVDFYLLNNDYTWRRIGAVALVAVNVDEDEIEAPMIETDQYLYIFDQNSTRYNKKSKQWEEFSMGFAQDKTHLIDNEGGALRQF